MLVLVTRPYTIFYQIDSNTDRILHEVICTHSSQSVGLDLQRTADSIVTFQAESLSHELTAAIPELQTQVDRQSQESEHLYTIDTVLRSQMIYLIG